MATDVTTLLWIAAGLLAFLLIWKVLKKLILAAVIGLILVIVGLIIMVR
jgi:hypothetical protein